MAKQTLNLGTVANDGTGDTLRTGGDKINDNFDEVYTKLDTIETGATADQTGAEIKALYEAEADTNAFTDADHSKLDGIEASADVTDQANVTAALAGGTVAGTVTIDGAADVVQLTVQGNSTQTNDIFVVENSAGTDVFNIDNLGNGYFLGDLSVNTTNSWGDFDVRTGTDHSLVVFDNASATTLTGVTDAGASAALRVTGFPLYFSGNGGGGANQMVLDSSGHIGIGTSSPNSSSILDLTSTTGALLLPRMTTTQRNALTATNGMLIYNTTDNKLQGYEGGAWANLI